MPRKKIDTVKTAATQAEPPLVLTLDARETGRLKSVSGARRDMLAAVGEIQLQIEELTTARNQRLQEAAALRARHQATLQEFLRARGVDTDDRQELAHWNFNEDVMTFTRRP